MLTFDSGLFDLCDGDLKSAILLNQILFWSDATNDPDGWFYKTYEEWELETTLSRYEINRILHGDKRSAKRRKRTLSDLGVETMVRKGRFTGIPTVHYRINVDKYMSALAEYVQERDELSAEEAMKFVLKKFDHSADEDDDDDDEFVEEPLIVLPHPKLRQILTSETQQSRTTQVQQSRTSKESEITTYKESSENDSKIISHPPPDDDSEFQIFTKYVKRFGKLKKQFPAQLKAELERLGAQQVGEVLERCVTRGRSWNYVLRALANERSASDVAVTAEAPKQDWAVFNAMNEQTRFEVVVEQAQLIPATERVKTAWDNFGSLNDTVTDAWSAAVNQMQMQFGAAAFLVDKTTLVDFKPDATFTNATFTVVVPNANIRDQLQQRYYRTVRRITSDVFGSGAEVHFVAKADWSLPENAVQDGG